MSTSGAICAIDPDAAQFLAAASESLECHERTRFVLHVGGRHRHRQQQPLRVGQDVALAPFDSLVPVTASRFGACSFGRLDALAVEATGSRMLVASHGTPRSCAQAVVDAPPRAITAPAPKVAIDALPLGKVMWHHPPLDAALDDVGDGVEDLAQVESWAARARGRRQPVFDKMPLAVGQVSGIALVRHTQSLPANLHGSHLVFKQALSTLSTTFGLSPKGESDNDKATPNRDPSDSLKMSAACFMRDRVISFFKSVQGQKFEKFW